MNAAKVFVVAVNVVNAEFEFVGETGDEFNRGGIHLHVVEDVTGYREEVGL